MILRIPRDAWPPPRGVPRCWLASRLFFASSSELSGTLGYLQRQRQRRGKSRTAGPCRAGQARVGWRDPLQVRPCKLVCCHPWQHTVPPTHPCLPFDRGLVRNGKSRCLVPPLHWLAFVDSFASLTCLACLACSVCLVRLARSVRLICVTFSAQVPQHESPRPCPSAALLCFAMATSQLSEAWGVWVGGTVVPHGCGSRAPMDGFTARPANPHTPRLAQPQDGQCARGVELLGSIPCQCTKQSHRPTVGGYPCSYQAEIRTPQPPS